MTSVWINIVAYPDVNWVGSYGIQPKISKKSLL